MVDTQHDVMEPILPLVEEVGSLYVAANVINEFVNVHGKMGVGMFRVYAGIKFFKIFSGNIDPSNRTKVQKLSSLINMPYRMVKLNLKRLKEEDLLVKDQLGHWHIASNKDFALSYKGGTTRIEFKKEYLYSNRATSKYLRAAIVTSIEQTYKVRRQLTPNKFFTPKLLRDKQTPNECNYLANGEAMVASSWTNRVVKKGYGVPHYTPLSGEYLSKTGIQRVANTIVSWRKGWPSNLGRWTPVQWVLNFETEDKRDEAVIYFKSISNIPVVSGYTDGVYYVALQMPSHFKSSLKFKRNNLDPITRKYVRSNNSFTSDKDHCMYMGICYSSFKHSKKHLLDLPV